MPTRWFGRAHGQSGQGLVEFAIIIALLIVVVIGAFLLLGRQQPASIFHNINNDM